MNRKTKNQAPSMLQTVAFSVKLVLAFVVVGQIIAFAVYSLLVWEKQRFADRALRVPARYLFDDNRVIYHRDARYSGQSRHVIQYAIMEANVDGGTKRFTLKIEEPIPYRMGESLTLLMSADGDEARVPELNHAPAHRYIAMIAAAVTVFFSSMISLALVFVTAFSMARKGDHRRSNDALAGRTSLRNKATIPH